MAVFLPIVFWLLTVAISLSRGAGWRESFLLDALIGAVAATIIIETLSLFHGFFNASVIVIWTLICLASLVILFQMTKDAGFNQKISAQLKSNPFAVLSGSLMIHYRAHRSVAAADRCYGNHRSAEHNRRNDLSHEPVDALAPECEYPALVISKKTPLLILISLAVGFLIFNLTLKWQPWHSRLHLPLFVLSASIFTFFPELARRKWALHFTLFLLIITSTQFIFSNNTRPLLGKHSIFRTSRQ